MNRPAVFLDRDGTLVEDVPCLHDPERLVLLPGVGELAALDRRLRRLRAGDAGGGRLRQVWPPSTGWRQRSTRWWRAERRRAEKRPDPLRP